MATIHSWPKMSVLTVDILTANTNSLLPNVNQHKQASSCGCCIAIKNAVRMGTVAKSNGVKKKWGEDCSAVLCLWRWLARSGLSII